MSRRTQAQWLSLIQSFQASGLSQTEFCQQHGINPKYFSKRKNDLRNVDRTSPFIAVRREAPKVPKAMTVRLAYHDTSLTLSDCSPEWLAQLLRGLQA